VPRAIGIGRESLLRLVQNANPLLWPLLACSVVMVGYIFERGLALRRGRVLPREFGKRFLERLAQGKLDRERAQELCRANDSPLARVFGHAVRYWGQPAATITQAIDHDSAGELLALRKNVRVLNATATIAPLLGLLGTVVGMVESFDAVGGGRVVGESRSEALAHGISVALITTAVGLVIAVISVMFYYYFLQRIDNLAHALDDKARQTIDLISAEALRSAGTSGRGPFVAPGGDHAGSEPSRPTGRSLGRVDTL
jgi:biopolymer transport protein ExbB